MQVKRTVRYLLSSFWKKLSNVFAYIIFTVDIINVTTTNYSSKRTTHSCKRQRTLAIYRNRVALLSKPGRNSLFAAFQCDHCDHYEHWEDGHIEHIEYIESPCRGVPRWRGAAVQRTRAMRRPRRVRETVRRRTSPSPSHASPITLN